MLTIALDTANKRMRLTCQSGRTHEEIIGTLIEEGFVFEDYATFVEIKDSLDWQRVLLALKIDPADAAQTVTVNI